MRVWRLLVLGVVASALHACGGGGDDGAATQSVTDAGAFPIDADAAAQGLVTKTLGCTEFLSVDTPIGRLSNNTWNQQAAGTFAWRQCLEQRVVGNALQYGWSWLWPSPGTTVYAYPEIIVGIKPWEGGPSNDSRFPRRITDTKRLLISYDLEVNTTGDHNLAVSIWLVRPPAVGSSPTLSDIAAEFMIWTDSVPAAFVPGGTKRDEITVDGAAWEVWASEDWGDASGANLNRWTYIAYRALEPTRSASYDARKLIADAVNRGLVSSDLLISDVELGNEIISGTGEAWIRSFSVTVD